MDNGWIKLHRKFLDWEWFNIDHMTKVFLFLLLSANHEDKEWQGRVIKRGQLVTGRDSLSKKTGVSHQSIRTCITRLKSTSEITIESTNKYTIITITKYEDYQGSNEESTSKSTSKSTNEQPTTNQQLTTNKNIRIKELKNKDTKHSRNIIPPEKEWVEKYCLERKNGIDAQVFIDHYTNTNWRIGKPPGYPMKDWEASIRTWEKNGHNRNLKVVDTEDYIGMAMRGEI